MKKAIRFIMILALVSLALQACQMGVPAFMATPTPTSTSTPRPTSTITSTPTRTPRPTKTPNLRETKEADDMLALVQDMKDGGYIEDTQGEYYKLAYAQLHWATIYQYHWEYIELNNSYPTATNFIVTTDVEWASASDTPNASGCGFVFRINDEYKHYAVFTRTTGEVTAFINLGRTKKLGTTRFGSPQINGTAKLTIVAVDEKIHVFVDGKHIDTYLGSMSYTSGGWLAYAVNSGTNKGYGTRCIFRNGYLFVMDD